MFDVQLAHKHIGEKSHRKQQDNRVNKFKIKGIIFRSLCWKCKEEHDWKDLWNKTQSFMNHLKGSWKMKYRLLKLWITIGSNDTKKKEGLSRKYRNRLVPTRKK